MKSNTNLPVSALFPLLTLVFMSVSVVFIPASNMGAAHASEPFLLDTAQMKAVSAGASSELDVWARGNAQSSGGYGAFTDVRTNANAQSTPYGQYRLDTAYATGSSFACCGGENSSSLDLNLYSNAPYQVGFVRIYQIESPYASARIGGGGVIGLTPY